MATINIAANYTALANAITAANPGDTIAIDTGTITCSASQQVRVQKCITIQGAGMDQTIIDSVWNGGAGIGKAAIVFYLPGTVAGNRSPNFIWGLRNLTIVYHGPDETIRLEGFSTAADNPYVLGVSHNFRMTGVRLNKSSGSNMIYRNNVIGIIDHCIFNGGGWCHPNDDNWGGEPYGHGSYTNKVEYGGDKFMYWEDCVITTPTGNTAMDGYHGSRDVVRHCRLINANVLNHGTETDGDRGHRATECYNCWFSGGSGSWAETRSGTYIAHDCIFEGINSGIRCTNHRNLVRKDYGSVRGENTTYMRWSSENPNSGEALIQPTVDQNYRLTNVNAIPSNSNPPLNGNVSPDLYLGTAAQNMVSGTSVFTASGANWQVNEWATIDHPENTSGDGDAPVSGGGHDFTQNKGYAYQLVRVGTATQLDQSTPASIIRSNTANTLTVTLVGLPAEEIGFTAGDRFAIRRCEVGIDQPGHGVSDSCTTRYPNNNTTPTSVGTPTNVSEGRNALGPGNINTPQTGNKAVGYHNQKLDPCYSWNISNNAVGFNSGDITVNGSSGNVRMWTNTGSLVEGRDFFNMIKPDQNYGTINVTVPANMYQAGGAPLINDQYSPGYPRRTSPTSAERRVGAFNVGPSDYPNSLTAHTVTVTGVVTGYQYPHPMTNDTPQGGGVATPNISAPASSYSINNGQTIGDPGVPTFQFIPNNFTNPPTFGFNDANTFSGSGITLNSSGTITGTASGATTNYDVTIKATNTSTDPDEVATYSFRLHVESPNQPPTNVTVSYPAGTYTALATVVLTATAQDASGTINRIDFIRGGSTIIATLGTTPYDTALVAPYTTTWTGVAAGTYSLTAKAYDDTGASTTSSPAISLTVIPGPTLSAPTITVTA